MKIGDRIYVHGYVDEIRKDTVIIRNEGGYFGTVKSEIVEAQKAEDIVSVIRSVTPKAEQQWIPCSERLPKTDNEVLITVFDTEDDYVEVYKGFYQDHEWWTQWCHGCLKIKDEPCGVNIVTAWMPLPEPYKGGVKKMDDLISRQAAIEEFSCCELTPDGGIDANDAIDILERLPSAQPEQRWIPCSERLPEDYTDVLVWFEYFRYGAYNRMYQTYGIGTYTIEYDSWMINHESGWSKLRVFAWMPLPEPYREERAEE